MRATADFTIRSVRCRSAEEDATRRAWCHDHRQPGASQIARAPGFSAERRRARRRARAIAVHRRLHLAVGERAIGGAEGQPQRQADLAVGNALALVAIELAHVGQRWPARRAESWRAASAAGSVSSTSSAMSRVTDGKRGSGTTWTSRGSAAASAASRSMSATNTASSPGSPCRSARLLASRPKHADAAIAAEERGGLARHEPRLDVARPMVASTRSARQTRSTAPFRSKKVDVGDGATPVGHVAGAGPGQGQRSAFAAPLREHVADLEQAHVALLAAAVVRDGVEQTRQRRGRSTAKVSDSGLAIGATSPAAANGAAAASAMKPNVTASKKPAPVSTRAQVACPGDARIAWRRRRRGARETWPECGRTRSGAPLPR